MRLKKDFDLSRYFWGTAALVLSGVAARADDCTIIWLDLFLPPAYVEFELTSAFGGLLTLKESSKGQPVRFELRETTLTEEDGSKFKAMTSTQTLVSGRISNDVTAILEPKNKSWLISFDNRSTIKGKEGQTFVGRSATAGYLICETLRP